MTTMDTLSQRPATTRRSLTNRARATNQPTRMCISGRTSLGRRVRDLAESFAQRLGGWPALSDGQAAAVRQAAELACLAEQARAEALRNGCVDPVGLARLEGVAARAERRLGLPRETRGPTTPSLKEYLANRIEPEVAG
jgi:hypothetical protein